MAHVFISYHKDSSKVYANQLADHLIASGFDVWIDDRIKIGDQWQKEIFQAIDQSAAVIVIMTPGASQSRWVEKERVYAEEQAKKQIFPFLLDGDSFPTYAVLQYADVRGSTMPPDAFFDVLSAAGVTRRDMPGRNVAADVLNEPENTTLSSPVDSVAPPVSTATLTPIDPTRRNPIRWIGFVIALTVITLLAFIALDPLNWFPPFATVTPTLIMSSNTPPIVVVATIAPSLTPMPTPTEMPTATAIVEASTPVNVWLLDAPTCTAHPAWENRFVTALQRNNRIVLSDQRVPGTTALELRGVCNAQQNLMLAFRINQHNTPPEIFDVDYFAMNGYVGNTALFTIAVNGLVSYLAGDFETAARDLSRAAELADETSPERGVFLLLAANSLLFDGQPDAANELYSQAIRFSRTAKQAYNNRGVASVEIVFKREFMSIRGLGVLFDGLLEDFAGALALTTDRHDRAVILTNWGFAWLMLGETNAAYDDGADLCRDALAFDEDYLYAHICLFARHATELGIILTSPESKTCSSRLQDEVTRSYDNFEAALARLNDGNPYFLADADYWRAWFYQYQSEVCGDVNYPSSEETCSANAEHLQLQAALLWQDRCTCLGYCEES